MKPEKQRMTDRIEWIDCAKGIGILLVIIGHTVSGILRGVIFSFHMPLFFILSCAVFQYSVNREQLAVKTVRGFRRLVIPAILMYVLSVLTYAVRNYELFSNMETIQKFILDILLTGIFSSGVPVKVFSYEVLAIGIPWFLIVLFLGRTLFDFLQIKLSGNGLTICCVLLSALGVWLGKIQWLPCSLDIVFAIMPIFYIGANFARFQVEQKPIPKFFFYGSVWAGTLAVVELSVILTKKKTIYKPFMYLGKNSLYLLFIHNFDESWFHKLWKLTDHSFINCILRILVDIALLLIIMSIAEKIKKEEGGILYYPCKCIRLLIEL